ncbi:MAG: hypothetical protein IKI97_11465 [Clostridia bacterium]|nr:hypothetical protein [Clostridia bacterium]
MKRKYILILFTVVLVFSITACTQQNNDSNEIDETKQQNVTLYSLTGTMQINAADIEEYLENGWYTEQVVTMYAADGRTRVTLESEIEAYKEVGWYVEPVTTMYAVDGRTRVTLESEIEAYKNVGWYTEPVVTMYAADGRTRVTLKSEVEAYKNVGWYIEPVVTMYAADGRTRITLNSEVEAYKKVGWFTEPVKVATKTQPKLYLKANASDSEFLSFANENYATLASIQGYVSMGAYFYVNYDVKISDSSAPYGAWWLVEDDVSNMEELKKFWYSHFSQSSDKNMYTAMYKEINGKLYSACPGVGGSDAGKPNYTKINKISNNRIEIIGTIDQYDEYGEYWDTRNSSIIMVLEDNIWMCERVR